VDPVRIAFAITELDIGGAERALVELVVGLPRDCWQPHVFCLGPWGPLATTLLDAGIPVTCFEALYLWDAPRVVWQLRRALVEFRPALLQTFLFHANVLGRVAGAWAGVPCVVSGVRVAERRGSWYALLDRWTNRWVTMNVCVSQGVAEFCRDVGGLDPRKLSVIPNGVDVAKLQREPPIDLAAEGFDPARPVCLTIGRLEHQKGIDLLLQAAASLATCEPAPQWLIIGDGPDRDRLVELAHSLGLGSNVRFLGRRGDVPRWLKGATLLVHPSRWEGMPNVVLEAMAAGCPVVATRAEGIAELIEDGVTGVSVPVEDSRALSEAIDRVLRQSDFRHDLSAAAQAKCAIEFTTSAMVDRYAALYQELLARQAKPR
jgi:glycosyltransferase involved in cell wall biosynthesis